MGRKVSPEVIAEFGETWPLVTEAVHTPADQRTPAQADLARSYYRFMKRKERVEGARPGRAVSRVVQNYFTPEQLARLTQIRNAPIDTLEQGDQTLLRLYRALICRKYRSKKTEEILAEQDGEEVAEQ